MEEHQEETWKDIVIEQNGIIYDYTGLYQVSNLGRVRSFYKKGGKGNIVNTPHMLKQIKSHDYLAVNLRSKKFSIHRLVATMFIPNPENLPCVNHKDENKHNNNADNLEWCTVEYNNTYGTARQRTSETKKGVPIFTDEQKAERSAKYTGKGNPMYGRQQTEEARKKMSESHKGKYCGADSSRAKKVVCINTGKMFDCIRQAQEWLGYKAGIGACCRGERKTAGKHPETNDKLYWMFYEDYLKLQEEENDR